MDNIDEVFNRLGRDILLAAQSGLNKLGEETVQYAREGIDAGIIATGPKDGEISTDDGAMKAGFYVMGQEGDTPYSTYEEALQAATVAADDPALQMQGLVSQIPQTIGRGTRSLHVGVGNAVRYEGLWEEGHINRYLGGAFAQSDVTLSAARQAETNAETVIGQAIARQMAIKQK